MTWSPPAALHASAPYRGKPFPQTHPDRLATLSSLFGLTAAPPNGCRVLELGCGDGGNLIPMAFGLPGAEFIGIDLDEERIEAGIAWAKRLKLSNIRLDARDIADVESEYGDFDYIIAHGVYSWIPERLRPKLLDLCSKQLRQQGVAEISFNALPGWHQLSMLREFSLFHAASAKPGSERDALLKQIRALSQLFAEEQPKDAQGSLFKALFQRLATTSDYLLLYDYLGGVSTPIHLHDFIEQAREHGLQYVSDANFFEVEFNRLPRRARNAVAELTSDPALREQYADFFTGRLFRRSLLAHASAVLTAPSAMRIRDFFLLSNPKPLSVSFDATNDQPEAFDMPHGARINVASPVVKTALLLLRDAWPCALSFADLVERVGRHLSGIASARRELETCSEILTSAGWDLYGAGALDLRTIAPVCVSTPSEHPAASALARSQLDFGDSVTNQHHDHTRLVDSLSKELFRRLDGSRDRGMLARELSALDGSVEGIPTGDSLATEIERRLATWARHGLLIA